jgi:ketosteroid isomerase-like protein
MITTDPAAVVTRYIYAVRDGDSGAIRDSFAEDAIWEYPGDLPLSGTWRGRDTIVDDFLGSVGAPRSSPDQRWRWKSPAF